MKYNVKRHAVVQPLDQSIRLIPLTKGQNTIVDAEEYERLSQVNWGATWSKGTRSFYAIHWGDDRDELMHNFIMRDGKSHDHKNHNTLDNRKSNLRACNQSQNCANQRKKGCNTSGYKGVTHTHEKRWVARITVNRKMKHLGVFSDPESAARAYDAAALRYFGEFAHLNFPSTSKLADRASSIS